MAKNINQRVYDAYEAEQLAVPPEDVALCEQIAAKYGASLDRIAMVTDLLQETGFGRNTETAAVLRAVADLIESPIPTAASLEARLDGQLQ